MPGGPGALHGAQGVEVVAAAAAAAIDSEQLEDRRRFLTHAMG